MSANLDPDEERLYGEQADQLYSGWSGTHDYDPRWDYEDVLHPEWHSHPLVQHAQTQLEQHTPGGRVFAADLAPRDTVGMYVSGTGADEPAILVDPYQHERHTTSPQEAEYQMGRTIDHEYRHALQDSEQGPGGPDFNEEDAEEWSPRQGSIAPDLKSLLPKRAHKEPDDRPVYYLWTFDPQDGKVYIDHNENKHPAHHVTHDELAPHVTHPDKVHGYAYSIVDGWRITNDDHQEVEDPYVVRRVLKALKGEHPEPALPNIRYHGI